MTDRNVDNVMRIMFKQKYAPETEKIVLCEPTNEANIPDVIEVKLNSF